MNDDPAAVAVEACIPGDISDEPPAEVIVAEEESAPWKLPPKTLVERPCNTEVRDAYLGVGIAPAIANFLGRRLDRFISGTR